MIDDEAFNESRERHNVSTTNRATALLMTGTSGAFAMVVSSDWRLIRAKVASISSLIDINSDIESGL